MSDYPRRFRNGFFRCCWLAVSDSLPITPALPVASLFSYRRRSIALLRLPARPSTRRAPAFVTAIPLSRPLRTETALASLQQTATRPRASAWRLAGFPIFGRECRILVRAHGSVAPGSSCPGGDLTPLRGAASSGSAQTQESIAEQGAAAGCGSASFSLALRARLVRPVKGCVPCPRGQPSPPSTSGAMAPSGAAIMAPSPGATDNRRRLQQPSRHCSGGGTWRGCVRAAESAVAAFVG